MAFFCVKATLASVTVVQHRPGGVGLLPYTVAAAI
jgi:hypothetical protein